MQDLEVDRHRAGWLCLEAWMGSVVFLGLNHLAWVVPIALIGFLLFLSCILCQGMGYLTVFQI